MHLLYCDESNLAEKAGDFLIYGGVIIDAATAREFSREIDEIRGGFGVERAYRLKFNPGPKGMSHQDFIKLKQAVLECAVKYRAQFIAYAILHDIAKSPDEARRNGINTVCYHFNCILNRLESPGLVLIDRFNDEGNQIDGHLADKFSIGLLDMPYSKEMRLENIVGFHYSAIGQSHFPGIVDVILGSLRFAINACTRNEEKNFDTSKSLLNLLSPMFFREEGAAKVSELGFLLSPKVVKAAKFRDVYSRLHQFLAGSGVDLAQKITGERQY